MKYNKIFRYEKGGFHKRFVSVDGYLKVETSMLPKTVLPLLAKELSIVAKEHGYKRINPYKFDTSTSKHIYIEYAEPTVNGYELNRKMIIRQSNKGNFKIPTDTFLFDVLDYFVGINLLDNDYSFVGNLDMDMNFQVIELHSKESLLEQGFKFPA